MQVMFAKNNTHHNDKSTLILFHVMIVLFDDYDDDK
jgi:hypothetical protein